MKASGMLRTYLQDHHAGSTAGVELARRAASSNEGSAYGDELQRIAEQISEDRDSLEAIMEQLGVGASLIKDSGAWTAEKLGRLKPNNRLLGYSPLSRLIELEGLVLGVTGKLALWEGLREAVGERIGEVDVPALIVRAEEQRSTLEGLRRRAAGEALLED